jgi:RHS repeat-associated protein
MKRGFRKGALSLSILLVGVMAWQIASAEVDYFHTDHLGSTAVGTNSSGAVQQVECYTPFGEILCHNPPSPPFNKGGNGGIYLFTGQELDREAALYYYGARYYDPALARFVSPDPLVQVDSGRLNPYAYAGNNPLRNIDPNGEDWTDVLAGMWDAGRHSTSKGLIPLSDPRDHANPEDFETGQNIVLAAAATGGLVQIVNGGSLIVDGVKNGGGLMLTGPATGGVGTVAGSVVFVAEAGGGVVLVANGVWDIVVAVEGVEISSVSLMQGDGKGGGQRESRVRNIADSRQHPDNVRRGASRQIRELETLLDIPGDPGEDPGVERRILLGAYDGARAFLKANPTLPRVAPELETKLRGLLAAATQRLR